MDKQLLAAVINLNTLRGFHVMRRLNNRATIWADLDTLSRTGSQDGTQWILIGTALSEANAINILRKAGYQSDITFSHERAPEPEARSEATATHSAPQSVN